MKKLWIALGVVVAAGLAGVVLLLGMLAPPQLLVAPDRGAVFEHVAIVEPGFAPTPSRRVVVEGGTIREIGPATPGAPFEGYLLPGLIDMHVHGADESIDGQADLFRLLYLAHGVTTVRNTGGGETQLRERERIDRGEVAGPRIFACGPLVDGEPPVWQFGLTLEDAAGAESLVATHVAMGYDCLKVYERLRPEVLEALVEAARAERLTVVGHVPQRVRLRGSGIDDLQHLRGVERRQGREPILAVGPNLRRRTEEWASLTRDRIEEVVRISVEEHVAHTPTLVLFDRALRMREPQALIDAPEMQLLPRFYGELSWDPRGTPFFEGIQPDAWALTEQGLENAKRVVAALARAGVRIHAGTDVGNPFLVPGASLHDELRLLVEAGLSPSDAWRAATHWAGASLKQPRSLGRVAVGGPADLLLFGEDPTQDLGRLGSLRAVVADGRRYSRKDLDAALEAARRHYRGDLYEAVSMAIGRRQRDAVLERMWAEAEEHGVQPDG